MTDKTPRQVLLVGPPKSGKTTYLAALYNVLEQADVPGALRLKRLGEDRIYLVGIRNDWASGQEISRTLDAEPNELTMTLNSPSDDDSEVELIVPDLLGESYDRYLDLREWPVWFDNFARSAVGVLLFVHPLHLIRPILILEVEQAVLDLHGSESTADGDAENSAATLRLEVEQPVLDLPGSELAADGDTEDLAEWSVDFVPTQVKLVELVQLLEHRQQGGKAQRIGLIISAWDELSGEWDSADLWMQSWMPLLYQFLEARASQGAPYRVFGVSAQGGDLIRDIEYIRSVERASDKIVMTYGGQVSKDITEPIRWLMQGA